MIYINQSNQSFKQWTNHTMEQMNQCLFYYYTMSVLFIIIQNWCRCDEPNDDESIQLLRWW